MGTRLAAPLPGLSAPAALAVGLAMALAAGMIGTWVGDAAGRDAGFLVAVAAVGLSAYLAGALAVLAAAVPLTLFEIWAIDPPGSFSVADSSDQARIVLFALSSIGMGLVGAAIRAVRDRSVQGRLEEHRARVESEEAARHAAALVDVTDAARRRLDVLVSAGQVLGASLDFDETLQGMAGVAIPLLGEYCIVDAIVEDGVRRFVAAAGEGRPDLAAVVAASPADLTRSDPIAEVMMTRRTVVSDLDDEMIARISRSESHGAALREMGIRHALILPLAFRDRTLGSLTFATIDPAHRYEASDIAVGEVLAQRAAKAVENARLHREVLELAARERARGAELRSVLAAIGEGIVLFDPFGKVRSTNAAADRMLDGPVTDEQDLVRRLLAGEQPAPRITRAFGPTEYRSATRNGRWLELTCYPLGDPSTQDGHGQGGVVVVRDVSAFRQGQGLREAFLGLLSHELRTPVTSIYAGAMVLGNRGDRLDPTVRGEILDDVAAEADRLFRLIEDLMVLARFDEGIQLLTEPSLLQRIVPTVVQTEQKRWPLARFTVRVAADLDVVAGDDTSIQQIVRNLLSNAAKYAPLGEEVEVEVAGEGDGVAVRVLDHGPGLGGATVHDLFSPFFRAPATAAVAAGAGIGLYVCQRLIEAMEGRIWALPRSGGGSEFGFWLPAYRVEMMSDGSVTMDADGAIPDRIASHL